MSGSIGMMSKSLDINNPDHKDRIQDILRTGADGEFWKIISQQLQATIDSLEIQMYSSEIASLPAEEYKLLTEVLKKQRQDRLDILDIPEDLVKELDSPDFFSSQREEEIYPTKEDFEDK